MRLLEGAGGERRLLRDQPPVRQRVEALGEGAQTLDAPADRNLERELRLGEPAALVLHVQVHLLRARAALALPVHLDGAGEVCSADVAGELATSEPLEGVVHEPRLEERGRWTRPGILLEIEGQGAAPQRLVGGPPPAARVQPERRVVRARGLPLHLERDPVHGLEQIAPHPMGQDAREAQPPARPARDGASVQLEEEVREVELDEVRAHLVAHRLQHDRIARHPEALRVHPQRRGLHDGSVPVPQPHGALRVDRLQAVERDGLHVLKVLGGQSEELCLQLHRDSLEVLSLDEHAALEDGLSRRDGEQVREEARGGRAGRDRTRARSDGDQGGAELQLDARRADALGAEREFISSEDEGILGPR